MFTVALVGRPNVGKSTLFNRLTGERHALVDDTPGVTRDRREGTAWMGDIPYKVIDTAGLEEAAENTLERRMFQQTQAAFDDADLLLMIVDIRAGILPQDEFFADLVRQSGKPVLLVVNKAEGKRGGEAAMEAYSLGIGEPLPISAEHGEGIGVLYDAIHEHMPDDISAEEEGIPDLQVAIVGRPNVGKSTFINQLLGEERVLTGPEAGITRDSIAIPFTWKGKPLKLVDTAGMRKRANVNEKLEKLAVADSLRAIQYAHVCVLMLDATQPLESQDKHIASHIESEGRGCVIALNKWDLVDDPEEVMEAIRFEAEKVMPKMKGLPIIPCSAKDKLGLAKVMNAAQQVYDVWNRRVSTGELNRWLSDVLMQHTPPLVKGRRIKIKYVTQAKTRPPSFALFSNLSAIPDSYLRYMTNSLRETFDLPGVPIRLLLRKGKNPYSDND